MKEEDRFLTAIKLLIDFLRGIKPKLKTVAEFATVILALGTAIMAGATIWLANINKESIRLTKSFYENNQRPILFWQTLDNFASFRLNEDTMRFEIDYISWFNTGEGPAFKIKYGTWIDNNKNPTGDTSDINDPVSFVVWPKQIIRDELRAHIKTPIGPECWRYLHLEVWYKDRFDRVYFDQTVCSIKIVNNVINHINQDGYYNYNWKSKKWE